MRRGRPEIPVTGTGEVAEFARHLRLLRQQSGLTLRQLAAATGFSTATLSEAQAGRELPTWRVAEAFIQGCGGSAEGSRERWERANSQLSAMPAAARVPPARGKDALAAMIGPPPLPVTAETAGEFMDCLTRVRIWAGDPPARVLARRARMPASTMQDFLRRKRLPTREMLLVFLRACGIEDQAVMAEWLYAWRHVMYAEANQQGKRRGHLRGLA